MNSDGVAAAFLQRIQMDIESNFATFERENQIKRQHFSVPII